MRSYVAVVLLSGRRSDGGFVVAGPTVHVTAVGDHEAVASISRLIAERWMSDSDFDRISLTLVDVSDNGFRCVLDGRVLKGHAAASSLRWWA